LVSFANAKIERPSPCKDSTVSDHLLCNHNAKMVFTLFSAADVLKMNEDWINRSHDVFVKKIVDDFVAIHIDRAIKRDVRGLMIDQIKHARSVKDLSVASGLCYEPDHRFWIDRQSMTIKQVIYRTDALERLAAELGPQIKVRPLYLNDVIYIMIEFWPTH